MTTVVKNSRQVAPSSANYPSTRGAKELYLQAPHTNNLYNSSFKYSGAKLYTPASLRSQRREDLEAEDVEINCLELHLWKKTFWHHLLTTWCWPEGTWQHCKHAGQSCSGTEVVQMADFNCDMLKPQPSGTTTGFTHKHRGVEPESADYQSHKGHQPLSIPYWPPIHYQSQHLLFCRDFFCHREWSPDDILWSLLLKVVAHPNSVLCKELQEMWHGCPVGRPPGRTMAGHWCSRWHRVSCWVL